MKFIILCFSLLIGKTAYSQNNDAVKITEARIALEKYKDCKNALAALKEVSQAGQSTSLFYLYAGKTYDCLNDFDKAIDYYELYLKVYPNSSDIIQRTAELRYEKRKKADISDLSGQWYPEGEAGTIRRVQKSGSFIKIFDPDVSGKDAIKFEGTLQPTGVYKGGRYWSYTKKMSLPNNSKPSCTACKFEGKDGYDDDYVFYEKTEGELLYVSDDGGRITLEHKVPSLGYESKYFPDEDRRRCICYLNWKAERVVYLKIK